MTKYIDTECREDFQIYNKIYNSHMVREQKQVPTIKNTCFKGQISKYQENQTIEKEQN